MKMRTNKALSRMHPAQINWAKAKALHDTLQEANRKRRKDNTMTDSHCKEQNDALKLFREATAQLLTFARDFGKLAAAKHGKPFTEEMERLYTDDLSNYMMTDILPNWWQSKVIDLAMRADASELNLNKLQAA